MVEPAGRLGLEASASTQADGTVRLTVTSRRFAYGVRLSVPGFRADDDAFSVEPGGARVVILRPIADGNRFSGGGVSALNLVGRMAVLDNG